MTDKPDAAPGTERAPPMMYATSFFTVVLVKSGSSTATANVMI
jgi:hypothetical protein